MKKFVIAAGLLFLIALAIPIEHKYDKLFRFFSLTLIPQGLTISPQFEKNLYFYLSDLAAIALTMMGLLWYRIPLRRFFGHPLWVVFLCALVSIIASPFYSYPIAYNRLLQLFAPLALFSFLAYAFSEEERPRITRLVFLAIFATTLFQCAIGIAQYFHEGPLGLRLLGEPGSLAILEVKDNSRWLLDRWFHVELSNPLKVRATGTLPHANVLGGLLVCSLLISYSLASKAKKSHWFFASTLPIQIFVLFLTYSRSALFAWVLGTVLWFVWARKERIRFLAGLVVSSTLLCGILFYPQIEERGGVVNYSGGAVASDQGRFFHQKLAFKILKDNPLLGLGYWQFSERAQPYFPPETSDSLRSTGPHNIYLFLACETGLISLAAFLIFIALLGFRALRLPFTPETASLTAIFVAFLFIGCCDFYPILFQQGKLLFFLLSGLLAAYCRKTEVEEVSKREVWKMFDQISPTYDKVNRILSLGLDQRWREKVAQYIPSKPALKILDLATGTGDQIAALLKQGASFTGIDLSSEMLNIAQKKLGNKASFLRADAEQLPFEKESFDAATFSFGIRNVNHPLRSLQEIHRVLKGGGRCLILEFSLPPQPMKTIYLLYLRYLLPWIGGLLSQKKDAYRYLNRTIEQFPSGKAFCHWMEQAGFTHLRAIPMAFGAVTLYVGDKQ